MSTRRVHLATGPVDIVVDNNSTAGDLVAATFWHGFFDIVCGADGEWSPEGAKQIKLWMEIELGVFDIDIYIYIYIYNIIYIDMHFAPLFMFLPLVHFLQFAEARRCHRNCPKYFARSAVAWQDIALQRPPPL